MRVSLQRNISEIMITEVRAAAQLSWWLKYVNLLVQRVLFLLSVVVLKEPFLCVLDETYQLPFCVGRLDMPITQMCS